MGEHINTKKDTTKHHKTGFSEGRDLRLERARRVTFKSYLKDVEEQYLLDEEADIEEWLVEKEVDGDWIVVESHLTEEEAQEACDLLTETTSAIQYRVSQG